MSARSNSESDLRPVNWVDEHGDYLFRYAMSRLRNHDSAEEVVQETFVAGLKAIEQYAGKGSVRAWLLGILKRKIIDHVRMRQRAISVADIEQSDNITEILFDERGSWREDPRIFGQRPDAALDSEEFWSVLKGCLEGLPERQRNVFVLREIEDTSSNEICNDLEITRSNLWVLLHRARLRLANCIKNKWHETEGA